MPKLYLDIETRGRLDLTQVGTDRYARQCEVILLAWALDDGPVHLHQVGEDLGVEDEFPVLLSRPDVTLIAHNAAFERTVFCYQSKLPDHPPERWLCTMAQALAHSMPGSLDALGRFLGIPDDAQKLADGKRLIKLFCMPQRDGKFAAPGDHPEDWQRFRAYCATDVEAMRECHRRMPTVNYPGPGGRELAVWHLDQQINDRGFCVDQQLARGAIAACRAEKERFDAAVKRITKGKLRSATQREALQRYLRDECGVELEDMKASTLRAAAERDLPDEALQLLNARRDVSRSSTAKYQRLLDALSPDGRLRGSMQYCGASRTGRWSGRIFQPLNLPRPNKAQAAAVPTSVEALRTGCAELVLDDIYEKAVYALRGVVVAPAGKRLAVADWNAIEGRILAWHAGEHWKVQAYRDDEDCYCLTYRRGWGLPDDAEVNGDQRQHGKVLDLCCGYEGGVSALLQMVPNYGVDLRELGDGAYRAASSQTREKAEWLWEFACSRGATHDLDRELYVKLECAKLLWRSAHPATVAFWRQLKDAAHAALAAPGRVVPVQRCSLVYKANMLALRLPSGRVILYAKPKVRDEVEIDEDTGRERVTTSLTYLAPYGGRDYLYGGKLANAATQGLARDIMVAALLRAERAGFQTVLHVYDEIVAEVRVDSGLDAGQLGGIMCEEYDFCPGLPLKAEGFDAGRYRK